MSISSLPDLERLCLNGIPTHIFDFLAGEVPVGTKEEEFNRLNKAILMYKPFLYTEDYYFRLRGLSGEYPVEVVPHLLAFDRYGRDTILQRQYAQFLKGIDLEAFMKKYSPDDWRIKHSFSIDLAGDIDSEIAEMALLHFTSLCEVTIGENVFPESLLEHFPDNLKVLTIEGSPVAPQQLAVLRTKSTPQALHLKKVDFTLFSEEDFSSFCEALRNVRELDLSGSIFSTDQFDQLLGTLESVERLTLDNVEESIAHLTTLPSGKLRYLSWKNGKDEIDEKSPSLEALKGVFSKIEEVILDGSRIKCIDFLLDAKTALKNLSLNNCSKLTDSSFSVLAGFTALSHLSLRDTEAVSYPFYEIGINLPNLNYLDISGCESIPFHVFKGEKFALLPSVETVIGAPVEWRRISILAD